MSTQPSVGIPAWTMGDRLRKARETAGLTQAEVAKALGIGRNSVGNYELGETQPKTSTLRGWARLTRVPAEWLAFGSEPGPSGSPVQPAGYTVTRPLRLVA